MNTEYVILVDEQDHELGLMEKMLAHREGRLHRAISVFIFNSQKQLLLQKRAAGKYHSAGLWTNTCCSHPRQGEAPEAAARRRLQEEMGLVCDIDYVFDFIYSASVADGMMENELDYVFFGFTDSAPQINTDEVETYMYADMDTIEDMMAQHPWQFTEWFKIIFERVKKEITA